VIAGQAGTSDGNDSRHFSHRVSSFGAHAYPFERAGRQVTGKTIQGIAAFLHPWSLALVAGR
jgi:hypothetical protein